MAYKKFANHYDWVTGADLSAAALNYNPDGIQAEFEDRDEASKPNGVISGLEPSISGTDIALSAGEAYCEGKRYSGAGTVAFNGAAANTYYVYVDPTSDTTPYTKGTTAPTTAQLCLGSVVWSGSALSALVDLREWGQVFWSFPACKPGTVTAGLATHFSVPYDCWLDDVSAMVANKPTGSTVIVDVRTCASGGTPTTVFTVTSYRPQILTSLSSFVPVKNTGYIGNNRKLTTGQVLAFYVDQTDSNAQATDLTITVRARVYGKSA